MRGMTPLDQLCICFDEVALNRRPTYDRSADAALDGGKLN